ncbi:Fur family ferric uptake transcriptional regulator [Catalinimonas alkaloidigena]|uniref:Fur family transcriptional regulator n=1 Tax=Catalinimonas alkaloidigena TaxID=1075417 RepID=UPI0024069585|nr:transcriptional repressor [Catalinimonas alkaloidigena]MDF9797113.1 Fur family ferric uptake transcriptional regulator [Catalinimonas alkaloidigena]
MDQQFLESLFHQHKLRFTKCRTDIIVFFFDASFALSAKDLETRLPQYDRVTIYRTLNSFIEKNIIHPIPSDGGAALYGLSEHIRKVLDQTTVSEDFTAADQSSIEAIHEEHIHFTCNACGKTSCLPEQMIPKVSLPQGYQVQEVEMVVKGYCKSCSHS